MCGINGLFAYNRAANAPGEAELIATRDHMYTRGPDGSGAWWSADRRLGLGHRRLSIVDLSERASQPMVSADGRYIVSFNGEIYNYGQLRMDLEARGSVFRTTSDTEVLLHLFSREGEAMVPRLRGMFAFAIWDNARRILFLARDPYGIKPLYTANDGWTFRFASQVKALLAGGKVSRDPEPAGVVGFHIFGSVPDPFTLFRDIRALPAGHSQVIDAAGPREPKPYELISEVLARGAQNPAPLAEIPDRVRSAALDSVRAHLLGDVEVGLFLSAGVDSGALLGLMRDAGQENIRAITLSFEEYAGSLVDEAPLASSVARLYGAEHIVRKISAKDFHADLPAMLHAMDQPSIDGVNTWFVSKVAREAGLKVALSGVGGDEVLASYPSFRQIPMAVRTIRPLAIVPGLGVALRHIAQATNLFPRRPKILALVEYGGTVEGAYLLRRGLFLPFELKTVLDPELISKGLHRLGLRNGGLGFGSKPRASSWMSRISDLESRLYLKNQLLRDADWAGMAHSIEIRTPFVDIEMLRAFSSIIPRLKGLSGKRALAAAPRRPLPNSIIERAKTGFLVPTERWTAPRSKPASMGSSSRALVLEMFASHAGLA